MLSKPSSVSAFSPPPPDVISSAGAHCVPLHFKTCPEVGAVEVVSTSVKSPMSFGILGLFDKSK